MKTITVEYDLGDIVMCEFTEGTVMGTISDWEVQAFDGVGEINDPPYVLYVVEFYSELWEEPRRRLPGRLADELMPVKEEEVKKYIDKQLSIYKQKLEGVWNKGEF